MPIAFDPPPTHATTRSGSSPFEDGAALFAGLVADDTLELAHDPRERVRAHDRADAVVRALDARDPLAHGVVHRVLEGRAARFDGDDLRTEQAHAPHVEGLALDVDRAHVDGALQSEQRGRGRGRHAVLACAGLRDDSLLAHAAGEERLAEHVVDLVRAGVGEVLALEEHPDAEAFTEAVALRHGRRPARVGLEQLGVLGAELGRGPRPAELRLELLERRHEGLGDVPPAPFAEPPEALGLGARRVEVHSGAPRRHERLVRQGRLLDNAGGREPPCYGTTPSTRPAFPGMPFLRYT